MTVSREVRTKSTENHQANIRKALEHRLEVAKAEGNQELVRALETEFRQLA